MLRRLAALPEIIVQIISDMRFMVVLRVTMLVVQENVISFHAHPIMLYGQSPRNGGAGDKNATQEKKVPNLEKTIHR